MKDVSSRKIRVGWAEADITPDEPVLLAGQFHARVSTGVLDKITSTVLAMESMIDDKSSDYAIMVSCDLLWISNELRMKVLGFLKLEMPELSADKIFFNATHTHSAPETNCSLDAYFSGVDIGIDLNELGVMHPKDYVSFAAKRIAKAISQAWQFRAEAGIGYGMGFAVVGRNRRVVYYDGKSVMYGKTNDSNFSHIEGYEDHSLYVMCTYDLSKQLTGILVNVTCPSQVNAGRCQISSDFWHYVRMKLRNKYGESLYIFAQCGAAGDISPYILYSNVAEARMLSLKGYQEESSDDPSGAYTLNRQLGLCNEIADRIVQSINSIMPLVVKDINFAPYFKHTRRKVELSKNSITESHLKLVNEEIAIARNKYEEERKQLAKNGKNNPYWYFGITARYRIMRWLEGVIERFEKLKNLDKLQFEINVLRIGDIVIAASPFELFVDYGIQIKARSPAVQTFIVQLSDDSTTSGYLPTQRAVMGGGYSAVAASNIVGPEGGRELVEQTLKVINELWNE